MGSGLQKVTPDRDGRFLRSIDFPHDLPAKLVVDHNVVVCQAALNPSGDTVVILVTPSYVDHTRQLNVTSNSAFSQVLKCGDGKGQPMEAPNKGMNMVAVNFGKDGVVAIQFLKQLEHSYCCCCCCCSCFNCTCCYKPTDFGTILIPKSLKGYVIVFFWPDDFPGEGWRNFILHDATKVSVVTSSGEITRYEVNENATPGCALVTDEEAERLRATFKI